MRTFSSKLKICFWRHHSSQPLSDCCAVCLVWFFIMNKATVKEWHFWSPLWTRHIWTQTHKCAHGVQAENTFRAELSPLAMGLRITTDEKEKSTINFLHYKVLSCRLLDLQFFYFIFCCICIYLILIHRDMAISKAWKTPVSCRSQCGICGKSLSVKWSDPTPSQVHSFPNIETLSIWEMGEKYIFVLESL